MVETSNAAWSSWMNWIRGYSMLNVPHICWIFLRRTFSKRSILSKILKKDIDDLVNSGQLQRYSQTRWLGRYDAIDKAIAKDLGDDTSKMQFQQTKILSQVSKQTLIIQKDISTVLVLLMDSKIVDWQSSTSHWAEAALGEYFPRKMGTISAQRFGIRHQLLERLTTHPPITSRTFRYTNWDG